MKNKLKKLVAPCAILTAALLAGCWQVSDGERAGVVTKFSHKGAVWSTWEGELHYSGANGTIVADSWEFSVDATARRGENTAEIVQKLTEAQRTGKRVKVTYAQEMFCAPWRAETSYVVQDVQIIEQ